jgi:hypothetical protein
MDAYAVEGAEACEVVRVVFDLDLLRLLFSIRCSSVLDSNHRLNFSLYTVFPDPDPIFI